MSRFSGLRSAALLVALVTIPFTAGTSLGASAAQIDRESRAALEELYATEPGSRELAAQAKAILIFPSIIKAGFMFGAQYGEGVLLRGGKSSGYYSSMAASYGLQVGAQTFGYVLFLMNDKAVDYVNDTDGWELGVGPTIVVVDAGKAKTLTTTTLHKDVYAFVFSQKGLMAGIGLQGSKISRIRR